MWALCLFKHLVPRTGRSGSENSIPGNLRKVVWRQGIEWDSIDIGALCRRQSFFTDILRAFYPLWNRSASSKFPLIDQICIDRLLDLVGLAVPLGIVGVPETCSRVHSHNHDTRKNRDDT